MPPLHTQIHKDEKISAAESAPKSSSKVRDRKSSNGIDECSVQSIYCDPMISSYGDSIGLALDIIVVEPCQSLSSTQTQTQKPVDSTTSANLNAGIVASSDFSVQFPVQPLLPDNEYRVKIQINGNNLKESFLCMTLPNAAKGNFSGAGMCNFQQGRSTKPSTEILNQLVDQQVLIPGKNLVRYILVRKSKKAVSESDNVNENVIPIGTAAAFCFLWSVHDKVIISDIDGTVTKSNVIGFVSTIVTEKYGHVHDGICCLFTELVKYDGQNKNDDPMGATNSILSDSSSGKEEKKDQCDHPTPTRKRGQVRFLYLSARPLKLINATRKFIAMLSQTQAPLADGSSLKRPFTSCLDPSDSVVEDGALQLSKEEYRLPPGPVLTHTGTPSTVIMTEIKKKTHEFKADTLTRQVVLPFVAAGKKSSGSRLFIAGFGNQRTDYLAYEMSGMNSHDIYIINKSSQLVSTNAKELELETVNNMDAVGVGPVGISCCVWEPFPGLGAEDAISSDRISVTNPDKISGPTTNSKRLFRGYADPKLKLELLNRLH